MKRFFSFLISLICLLVFTTSVSAISNSISVYNNGYTYEFIDGLEVNYYYSGSYPIYVLDIDTYYSNYTTLSNPRTVSSGFDYIINNSNPTSNSEKNYYITQVAVLWYEDYLNGNDNNISASMKNYITNNTSNTVCYYINKLVNSAKNYNDSNYISISNNNNISFSKNGSYYYSNIIYVTTNNLTSAPTVGVYNAPSNTTIVEKNVYANGNGSFQIRIPVSSLNSFNRDDFEVYVKGYTNNRVTYVYSYNGTEEALYGYNYSSSNTAVEESIPVVLDNVSTNGSVRLEVLDANGNNIKNVKYYIYKGNCKNTTCTNSNYLTQFTTNSSYTNFDGILTTGTYTLVRQTNTNYNLNEKELIEVTNRQTTQTIYIYENGYNSSTSVLAKNFNIKNSINDYSDVIKIYNSNGNLVSSYRSNNTSYNITLNRGNYYIVNSNNTIKVNFEISNDGKLYITENNKREEVSYINLDKYLLKYPSNENNNNNNNNIDKDNTNDYYTDENGTIYIDSLENIESIEVTQKVTTETNWISNIIDCPITSVSSTIKYIIGAIIIATGIILTIKNVKKQKNNI